MKKYDHAHKYGWYDFAYDFMNKKPDLFMVFLCLVLIGAIIAASKLGLV